MVGAADSPPLPRALHRQMRCRSGAAKEPPLLPQQAPSTLRRSDRPSRIRLVHLLRHPRQRPTLASSVRRGSKSNEALERQPEGETNCTRARPREADAASSEHGRGAMVPLYRYLTSYSRPPLPRSVLSWWRPAAVADAYWGGAVGASLIAAEASLGIAAYRSHQRKRRVWLRKLVALTPNR